MNTRKLNILASPGFLFGLFLLLLNDFALKSIFHNWLTAKLSDFAGLFLLPLFCATFLPCYKRAFYFLTALLFLLWKSAYSQFFIDTWNALAIIPIYRVVDVTDLVALLVLPFSYYYFNKKQESSSYRIAPYFIAVVSLFAFTATSYRTEKQYDNKYQFQSSKIDLTRKLYHFSHLNSKYDISTCASTASKSDELEIEIPSNFCFSHVNATISISETPGQSIITLKRMEHQCPEGRNDTQELLAIFEKDLIGKLNQFSLEKPSSEASIISSQKEQLSSKGQIYFVSIGEIPDINIEELANHFRRKYRVGINVLPKLPLTDEVRQPNFPNSRPVAVKLIEYMASKYPNVAQNPESLIIGITEDMNVEGSNRMYNFSFDLYGHLAVVATESMNPSTFCEPPNKALLESRLRKVIARTIGNLHFHLPKSENPKSVLYSSIGCVDELDYQGEDF